MVELNLIKKLFGGCVLALMIALVAGCQGTGNKMPPFATGEGSPAPAPTDEKFNRGDLVVVTFSGLSDVLIPPHEERVKEDGTITLPLIGPVVAQGKGPGELQKEVRNKYVEGKLYPESLNVTVKGLERSFYVDGEVRSPSRYVWSEGMTVLKAISSAGGFTDFANKGKVTVTRLDGRTITIDCEKAMKNPVLDLSVYPGDRVVVARRWI